MNVAKENASTRTNLKAKKKSKITVIILSWSSMSWTSTAAESPVESRGEDSSIFDFDFRLESKEICEMTR